MGVNVREENSAAIVITFFLITLQSDKLAIFGNKKTSLSAGRIA
jgi:hypothetical protein